MTSIVLHFPDERAANSLVAGIPAAARAAHQVALAAEAGRDVARCFIAVPGGWQPSRWCESELERLAFDLELHFIDADDLPAYSQLLHLRGAALPSARAIGDLLQHPPRLRIGAAAGNLPSAQRAADDFALLEDHGRAIIAATGKAGDGIVSRHLNRPISRSISSALLRFPGMKPGHATLAAAVLGLLMAWCLFTGGEEGLLIGAVLYQMASIVDGVDGEVARATFRSSRTGALLDSLTDAATNLAFFAGVASNLWLAGDHWPAAVGATGMILLFVGLMLIGSQALSANRPFSFDLVKEHFGARPSRVRQWLTWLTMRDFYAAAAAVCVLAGLAAQMLVIFTVVVAGWLAISLIVISRASQGSEPQLRHEETRLA